MVFNMENSCSKDNCEYPVVNKKYQLCQVHNWERINGGDFFEHQARKQKESAERMQKRQLEKQKLNPPKPYIWKPKKDPKPIPQISGKMAKAVNEYSKVKKEYIKENPECEVHFCNCTTAKEDLTIHHKKGRTGYADEQKRLLDIPLLLDKDYFLACCIESHNWIELNPEEAKEMGYSVSRLEVK